MHKSTIMETPISRMGDGFKEKDGGELFPQNSLHKNAFAETLCNRCGSDAVIKYGKKVGISSIRQVYFCKNCNFKFIPAQFRKTHSSLELTAKCLELYFRGMSFRKVTHYLLRAEGLKISHSTVERFVKLGILQVETFVKTFVPVTSENLCVDETQINVRREPFQHSWNTAVLDQGTRYCLASASNQTRDQTHLNQVILQAVRNTSTPVKTIVSDGLMGYPRAVARAGKNIEHLNTIRFAGNVNNNLIERYWGRLKDRTKTMRGLHKLNSCSILLSGYVIHYNCVEPHLGLNGLTPAQKAGINLPVPCSWKDLLELSKETKVMVTI